MLASTRALWLAGAAAIALTGCGGGNTVAPVGRVTAESHGASSGLHRVRAGDTLYSIAWRYGLDYRDLARWNAIVRPFTIVPGQRLRISRPAVLPAMPRREAPARVASRERAPASEQRTARERTKEPEERVERSVARAPARSRPKASYPDEDASVTSWLWPARGEVIGSFGARGGKGIDIAGTAGAPVVASARGRVVYSGSGLRGYGKLIIVKHNKRYLSAYAHNQRLHVKEGDTVDSGQRIADMGSSDAKSVRLHFEIRRDGKPVDPIRYLPG